MSVEAAASHLVSAYRSGTPVDPLPGWAPADIAEAYAIQAAVLEGLGAAAGAFKAGRKTADDVPMFAPIRAETVHLSGATIPTAESRLRGVELEVGFRLERDPPAPDTPDFATALADVVVAVPCLEIVEARLSDPDAADPLWKLADNQANGALIVGDPVADWQSLSLASPSVDLSIGGRRVKSGVMPAPGGPPFDTFAALVRALGTHCGGLHAGHVVICGSLTGVDYANAGDALSGSISGLGTVSAQYAEPA